MGLSLAWHGLPFGANGLSHASELTVSNSLSRFSDSAGVLPPSWRPLLFPKIQNPTHYQLIRDPANAVWVMEARSSASASGLIHACDIDLREFPVLRWRWKVEGVLSRGDARRKDGDDYAARIYLSFASVEEDLTFWERTSLVFARMIYAEVPSRAINYIWANKLAKGASVDSAYAGRSVKLVAVQSGGEEVERWHTEERDVYADYLELFGSDPPRVKGVAIMTDSDDTGERVRAWYGDIEFLGRASSSMSD